MAVSGSAHDRGKYQNTVFQVEPFGVEEVTKWERHGSPFQLFTLWLGANLTIADFALGFLPVHLGLSWRLMIISILVGNLAGALMLAACATMGPAYGLPQLMIGRYSFGRVGEYLPALFNWIGTIGWFTVNNILGAFGLRILLPQLSFFACTLLLIVVQGVLAIYGHNLIHAFEKWMAVILGVLFLIASFISGSHLSTLQQYQGTTSHPIAMAFLVAGAVFSFVGSWAPYASDYSRYLPEESSRSQVFGWTFLGAFLASVWLEILGATIAVLAGPSTGNAIQSLADVTGNWGTLMVAAVVLGGIASNALNLYSNALSAGALDIRISRAALTVIAMVIGFLLSFVGAGKFESFYEDFLLLLGYWVTPWVAILIVEWLRKGRSAKQVSVLKVRGNGIIAFLVGLIVSIPFFSSSLYTGPLAALLHGADISFYVGFLAAGLVYGMLEQVRGDRVIQ